RLPSRQSRHRVGIHQRKASPMKTTNQTLEERLRLESAIPHSAFRTPHSPLAIPHSAFRTPHFFTRREALKTLWAGFGYTAFAGLAAQAAAKEAGAKAGPLAPKSPPLPARAKHVIF